MTAFVLTVTLNTADRAQSSPRVAEALRDAAQKIDAQLSNPPTPYTRTDQVGNTWYSWTVS